VRTNGPPLEASVGGRCHPRCLHTPIILELLVKSFEKLIKRFPRLILIDFDLPTEPCGSENDGQLMLHLWTHVRIPGG